MDNANIEIEALEIAKNTVKAELGLINIREVEIEDLKLRIEDLELEGSLTGISYDDMPKGSSRCKNNDIDLLQIENMKTKIKKNEIKNRRILNALKILEDEEYEIVERVLINKDSINKTAISLGRQRKTINAIKEKALEKLAYFYK